MVGCEGGGCLVGASGDDMNMMQCITKSMDRALFQLCCRSQSKSRHRA